LPPGPVRACAREYSAQTRKNSDLKSPIREKEGLARRGVVCTPGRRVYAACTVYNPHLLSALSIHRMARCMNGSIFDFAHLHMLSPNQSQARIILRYRGSRNTIWIIAPSPGLRAFQVPIILIPGGMSRAQSITPLRLEHLSDARVHSYRKGNWGPSPPCLLRLHYGLRTMTELQVTVT
jgi:hypothetical protein